MACEYELCIEVRGTAMTATMDRTDRKTTNEHWDHAWSKPPRMRLPSRLNLSIRNTQRLLRTHVRRGMRFLEIGCAPGKMLAWVAEVLGADVAGLDYSKAGMGFAQQLFDTLGIPGDLRCEDVFDNSFKCDSFDVVYSSGLIEHFDDPRDIVREHVTLLRPGGKAIITIPKLVGWWGFLTGRLDPPVLEMHNLDVMRRSALLALAPSDLVSDARAYHWGRISLHHAVPIHKIRYLGTVACRFADLLGLLQPFDIPFLCPHLVLEMTRRNGLPG